MARGDARDPAGPARAGRSDSSEVAASGELEVHSECDSACVSVMRAAARAAALPLGCRRGGVHASPVAGVRRASWTASPLGVYSRLL